MNRRLLSALCFVMLAANAMGEEPVTFPDVEWEVRTPAEVGLDVAKLEELSAWWGGGATCAMGTWSTPGAIRALAAPRRRGRCLQGRRFHDAVLRDQRRTAERAQRHGAELRAAAVSRQGSDREGRPDDVPPSGQRQSGYVLPEAPGDAWAYNDYAFKLYKYLVFGQLFGDSPTSASEVAEAIAAPERLGPLQFQDGSLIAIIKGAPRWNATLRDTARLGWFWLNKGRWKAQQLLPQACSIPTRWRRCLRICRVRRVTPRTTTWDLVPMGTAIPIRVRPIRITARTGSTTSARMARWMFRAHLPICSLPRAIGIRSSPWCPARSWWRCAKTERI